jgi:hypothetical protein
MDYSSRLSASWMRYFPWQTKGGGQLPMKDFATGLLLVGLAVSIYLLVDALTTENPNRRKTDLEELNILETGMEVIKAF